MYEPKTDLQIKYELSREYLFEQMMPPGAPFGSYRIIPFPFYERRVMDTLPISAAPGSPLWYLEMILLPTGCNAYTIEGLVSKFRKGNWDTQTAVKEYPIEGDTKEKAKVLFRSLGRITDEGEDKDGICHIGGYIYLSSLKPRDTRCCDKDPYRYICRIPVYCDCACLPDKIMVKCHGIQTGQPDDKGHARIDGFRYDVMADVHPAYRALELIGEELKNKEAAEEESYMHLRKMERHAYNIEYTAMKALLPLILLPAIYIAVYMRSGTGNPSSILFSLFILSIVAIPAMLISSWWLHQRYKRLIKKPPHTRDFSRE